MARAGEIDIEVDHAIREGNASAYCSLEHTLGVQESEGIVDHPLGEEDIAGLRAILYLKGPLAR